MSGLQAALLPDQTRFHLQHGPIDLIIGVNDHHNDAFYFAHQRFASILDELVAELAMLRMPIARSHENDRLSGCYGLKGAVAKRMLAACEPLQNHFITPMAAVAGAVADEILDAIVANVPVSKAYVNNGGDIALHLTGGYEFHTMMAAFDGQTLGHIHLKSSDPICGMATSGRHGRSLSLGIADSVTVLAKNAACADAAATLIANAVDVRDNPHIRRAPAKSLQPDSDLADRLVVTDCAPLCHDDVMQALDNGEQLTNCLIEQHVIVGAALFLQGQSRLVNLDQNLLQEREKADA